MLSWCSTWENLLKSHQSQFSANLKVLLKVETTKNCCALVYNYDHSNENMKLGSRREPKGASNHEGDCPNLLADKLFDMNIVNGIQILHRTWKVLESNSEDHPWVPKVRKFISIILFCFWNTVNASETLPMIGVAREWRSEVERG